MHLGLPPLVYGLKPWLQSRGPPLPLQMIFLAVMLFPMPLCSPDKMFAYLHRWLAYCSALIFQFLPHDSEATPLSGDHWRAFLSGSIDDVHDKDWQKDKKLSMQRILGNAVKDFGGASEEEQLDIQFKGQHVSAEGPISADVVQEILWEVSKLNS